MDVEEIDPLDDEALREWWEVQCASRIADWPDDPPFTLEAIRAIATRGFGAQRTVLAVARDAAATAVGCSRLDLPTSDNTWTLEVDPQVHPAHRRRGAGRALVCHAEDLARREHRTTITSATEEPLEGRSPGRAFAEALGFEAALPELRRDLRLPVEDATLDRLEAESRPFADGYRIVTWLGACPAELLEGRLELERALSRDMPHGELEREDQVWDAGRMRAVEETVAQMGHVTFHAGAVSEATGRLVAVTLAGVAPDAPSMLQQWATIVLPSDRGHRLGMLVKIANLRAVAEHSPETRKVSTWNAESNEHMSRVNDEMGFVVVARASIWQKRQAAAGDAP